MKSTFKYFLIIFSVSSLFFSCDRFNKLLKSNDYELKLKRAKEYYDKGNYIKATQLYDELIPVYKGSEKAEEIYYYYGYCNYYQGDYGLAQFHFKNFTRQFPASKHSEECYFMNAYCYYLNSPYYSLDPTDTKNAIKEFQSFVDEYPESERIDTCNKLVDRLRYKLELKDYDIFKQYFNLSEYYQQSGYKSAITSGKSFLKEYPDSKYVEEVAYLIIESYYLQAINSIPSKKAERLEEAIENYLKFVDLYPKSNFLAKAEQVYTNCLKEKENILKKQKNGF